MVEGLKDPETQKPRRSRRRDHGELAGGFAAYIRSEIPKWTAVVKSAGVKME